MNMYDLAMHTSELHKLINRGVEKIFKHRPISIMHSIKQHETSENVQSNQNFLLKKVPAVAT